MANVLTVNLAHPRPNSAKRQVLTGIDKRPTDDTITVRAPGPMHGGLGSGLLGDFIGISLAHGGDDQAGYAYAREDLDVWQHELERDLDNGMFGENFHHGRGRRHRRSDRRAMAGRLRRSGA